MNLALYSTAFVLNLVGLTAAAYRHEVSWVALLFPLAMFWFAAAATSGEDPPAYELDTALTAKRKAGL